MKNILVLTLSVLFFVNQPLLAQQKNVKQKNYPKKTEVKTQAKKENTERIVEITTNYGSMLVKLFNETPKHRDNFLKLVKNGFYDSLLFHRVIKGFMIQGGDPNSKYADSTQMLGNGDLGYKIDAEFVPSRIHKRGVIAAARDNNPLKQSSGCQFYIVQGRKYELKEIEQIMNNKNLQKKQELLYKYSQVDSVSAKLTKLQHDGDKEQLRKYFDEMMVIVDAQYKATSPLIYNNEQIEAYFLQGGAPHLDGEYTVFGEVIIGMDVVDKIAEAATGQADRPKSDVRMKMKILQ